jgi:hypothetical protein
LKSAGSDCQERFPGFLKESIPNRDRFGTKAHPSKRLEKRD